MAKQTLDETVRTLDALRDMGVVVAPDDVGVGDIGYSNPVAYQLPIDVLKLDQPFVSSLTAGIGGC